MHVKGRSGKGVIQSAFILQVLETPYCASFGRVRQLQVGEGIVLTESELSLSRTGAPEIGILAWIAHSRDDINTPC
jgi:hypothetical protein